MKRERSLKLTNSNLLAEEPALLVHTSFEKTHTEDAIAEFCELALSAGMTPLAVIKSGRKIPDPKYLVGSGKAQEILAERKITSASRVLFNHDLSPIQKRNLEQLLECPVLDRTELILEIFSRRARSFEGKLQVELAQLQYLSSRLVRGWTHLERQKGGIGLRGGPGETQLEVDRRLLRNRIKLIQQRLEKVRKQRNLGRRARKKAAVPSISFVGYTNAGKSTLFNTLTRAKTYVADQLFATLDPTLRHLHLPEIGNVVLADTVGFIRNLPHDLIHAFHATLEEAVEARLLVHVIDASNPAREVYISEVEKVLKTIGAESVPVLQVFNKIDLLPNATPKIVYDPENIPIQVWISAVTGDGVPLLKQALTEILTKQ